MILENLNFAYHIIPTNGKEFIIGLNNFFEDIVSDTDKKGNISTFPSSTIIGTLAFELIQDKNIKYNKKTNEHIRYFRYYIEKCIKNNEYCDNRVFLSCLKECYNITLPKKEIILKDYFNSKQLKDVDTYLSDYEHKTKMILDNKNNINYETMYYCSNIEDLFIASMYEIFEKKYTIRKCENCNRFFITKEKGKKNKYCYNTSPQNNKKTCYQYVSQMNSIKKRKDDDVIKSYNNLTGKLRNRMDRTKNDSLRNYYQCELLKISDEYYLKKKEFKKGKINKNDIINFLNEYSKKIDERKEQIKNGNSRTNKK